MKMAFVLFDGVTSMDFVGFYEAVTWLAILNAKEDVSWTFCANTSEVTDDRGLKMKIDEISPDLGGFDLVFLPGGMTTRKLQYDEAFLSWIRTAQSVPLKVSVCTGALLWGAAGYLTEKKATTNASAFDLLSPYCKEVVHARVVRDGDIITGGGVTASIELGLYVVEWLTDAHIAAQVQEKLEYPYYQTGTLTDIYYGFNQKMNH